MYNKQVTPNFNQREWLVSADHPELAVNLMPSTVQMERMRMITTHFLQPLRDAIGRPLNISSGYRDRELNSAVDGHVMSRHMMRGDLAACDISAEGLTPKELVDICLGADNIMSCEYLLIYPNFVHVSFGPYPQSNEIRWKVQA